MLRKLGRTMTGHDFLHHFPLHKPPRPIAGRALLIREELFNRVIIQRGRSHVAQFRRSTIYARDFRSMTSTRRAIRSSSARIRGCPKDSQHKITKKTKGLPVTSTAFVSLVSFCSSHPCHRRHQRLDLRSQRNRAGSSAVGNFYFEVGDSASFWKRGSRLLFYRQSIEFFTR